MQQRRQLGEKHKTLMVGQDYGNHLFAKEGEREKKKERVEVFLMSR